jgi:hypothetical protein
MPGKAVLSIQYLLYILGMPFREGHGSVTRTAMALLALGLVVLGVFACDPIVTYRADPPESTKLTLTGLKTTADSLETGAEYPVYGVLRSDSVLELLEYSLWRGDQPALSEHGIRLLWNGLRPGRREWDLRSAGDVRIDVDPAAQEGEYSLVIKATAGDTVITFPLVFTLFKLYEPKTAATVVGIWRADFMDTTTEPPTEIRLTAQIDAGGTMVVSRRIATGQPTPFDFAPILRENSDWRVEEGEFRAVKTLCEYRDPITFEPTSESDCRAPLELKSDIIVSRGVWTLADYGDTTVLLRD